MSETIILKTEDIVDNFRDSIITNLKSRDMSALKIVLDDANEFELLSIIGELSAENQAIVYRLLSKDRALFVFEQLDITDQEKLMNSFTEEAAVEIITELDPDDRVRLLDELPAAVAKRMLAALSPQERAATNLLMGYEAHTAGRIMTPEYVRLNKDMTVSEAVAKVKQTTNRKEMIYILYVTDYTRKLEGIVSLSDLFFAEPYDTIESIMQTDISMVSTDEDQEEAARMLQKLDLLSIAVVDKEGRIVGIITVDDAMDILEEESTEDMYNQAGLANVTGKEFDRSDVLVNGNLLRIWAVRLPFLLVILIAGWLAGLVIGGFEEALMSTAAVAAFIPFIMNMGGAVGTQSSTVFARGVVLGHISMNKFMKHFLKEIGVGLSIGGITGVVGGVLAAWFVVWFFNGDPMLGLPIGLALLGTVTLAALMGFLVPFALIKMNVDQAAGASPIVTSLKDISGLIIYFVLVNAFMGGLM